MYFVNTYFIDRKRQTHREGSALLESIFNNTLFLIQSHVTDRLWINVWSWHRQQKTINNDSNFVHMEYEQTESLLSKQERAVHSPFPFPFFNDNTL